MSKNKILIGSFILLSMVISLFPPFSWGGEKFRTINERQRMYNYKDHIPVKEYDFLFNDLKKEFIFSNNKITLERHLIISELLIEIFVALLLSIFFQFLYNRFSYKALFFGIYFLTIILCLAVSSIIINKTSVWFQPNYSSILEVEIKIKNEYGDFLSERSVNELSRIVDNFKKGFKKEWDDSTNNFWNSFYSSIELSKKQYPKISNFLKKNVEKKAKSTIAKIIDQNILNLFEIYRGFTPPSGYSVNVSKLLDQINLAKYYVLLNRFKKYPAYTSVLNEYRKNFRNYWTDTIPKIKTISSIGIVIFISILFYLKREWLIHKINFDE